MFTATALALVFLSAYVLKALGISVGAAKPEAEGDAIPPAAQDELAS
jgi:hypothetical protein